MMPIMPVSEGRPIRSWEVKLGLGKNLNTQRNRGHQAPFPQDDFRDGNKTSDIQLTLQGAQMSVCTFLQNADS